MIKIHRKIEYALIALKHMRHLKPGELISAKEISEIYRIPFDPLSRVMQLLTQKHILHAEHGVRGGYQIRKDLREVTYYDLVEAIMGSKVEIAKCLDHTCACEFIPGCNIIPGVAHLNEKVHDLYKTISVMELIESHSQHEKRIKEVYETNAQQKS